MLEKLKRKLEKSKKLLLETGPPQSILGIWMLYQTQYRSLSERVRSFFSRMMDRKRTFSARVKEMYSTAGLQVVEKVLHFLLIRYVIVTILIIVAFFSAVRWMNLPS